jgi:hypothetical protein
VEQTVAQALVSSGRHFSYRICTDILPTAAPQVAGLIATYLSMDNQPWNNDLRGLERVRAIRDYVTSEGSSSERNKGSGVNIIWNGAQKEDHESAGANNLNNSPPPASPPPQKTKALSIILQAYTDEAISQMSWLFFQVNFGESALCKSDKDAVLKHDAPESADIDNPPWPRGTFPLKIHGMDCEYKNEGNEGELWCKEKNGQAIPCKADDMKSEKKSRPCDKGLWSIEQHAVVTCEW